MRGCASWRDALRAAVPCIARRDGDAGIVPQLPDELWELIASFGGRGVLACLSASSRREVAAVRIQRQLRSRLPWHPPGGVLRKGDQILIFSYTGGIVARRATVLSAPGDSVGPGSFVVVARDVQRPNHTHFLYSRRACPASHTYRTIRPLRQRVGSVDG